MRIGAALRNLSLRQLFNLSRVLILHPRFIVPTYSATRETLRTCDDIFGKKHHGNNRTNAFRHALWNFLICKKCLRVAGSAALACNWSRKITNLHEQLLPNEELAKEMDLHNNQVGRNLFLKVTPKEINIVQVLMQKMKEAERLKSLEELAHFEDKLVFIEKLTDKS